MRVRIEVTDFDQGIEIEREAVAGAIGETPLEKATPLIDTAVEQVKAALRAES